jgi:hypothetical protein
MLHGGSFHSAGLPTFTGQIERFHATLAALRDDFADAALEAHDWLVPAD